MLLLSKCDLVGSQDIERHKEALRELNKSAPVLAISNGVLATDIFFGIENPTLGIGPTEEDEHHHSHESDFSRWSFKAEGAVDKTGLLEILEMLPSSVLRLKGIFKSSEDDQLWTVHKVGSYVDFSRLTTPENFSGKAGFVAIGLSSSNLTEIMDKAFATLD